jgi:hypothetical protein
MTYYKVTTTKLKSLAVSQNYLAQDFVVTYELNAWVYPKHKQTKLFVFNDYQCALDFAQNQSPDDYKIWECEVLNPTKEYALFVDGVYSRDFIGRLIDMLEYGPPALPSFFYDEDVPPHTVFADTVKLTKLVTFQGEE